VDRLRGYRCIGNHPIFSVDRVAEEEGAENASYALKLPQSEGEFVLQN